MSRPLHKINQIETRCEPVIGDKLKTQETGLSSEWETAREVGIRLYFTQSVNPKSLIKIVLSTTSMLKSDHTFGYSRLSNSSFANLFFKMEWTCALLNRFPRTVRYPSLFIHSAMASKVMPFSRCSEMV